MSTEYDFRKDLLKKLKCLDAIPVENPASPGTPDVNYIEGWFELKKLKDWPKKKESIVRIDHFTNQQRVFLWKRALKGGNVDLILQVKREILLFNPFWAAEKVGKVTKDVLIIHAKYYSRTGLTDDFASQIVWRNRNIDRIKEADSFVGSLRKLKKG